MDRRCSQALSTDACGAAAWSWRGREARQGSQPVMHVCQVCFEAGTMQSRVYLACGLLPWYSLLPDLSEGGMLRRFLGRGGMEGWEAVGLQ